MSKALLKKLTHKKYREETGLFLVEGKKSIEELLCSDFKVSTIYATLESISDIEATAKEYSIRTGNPIPEIICVTEEKLATEGTFRSNNAGIAIAAQKRPPLREEILACAKKEYVLVLDDIRDPGNLGTIIRTADWFGVSYVVISPTTADVYNPKVISASMGSFTRVKIATLPLSDFLKEATSLQIPSLGAFMEGTNIYEEAHPNFGLILMGSESHGIGADLESYVTEKITIPRIGNAESLNVATATGIILALLRRP